jgi:hypothetical protein
VPSASWLRGKKSLSRSTLAVDEFFARASKLGDFLVLMLIRTMIPRNEWGKVVVNEECLRCLARERS